jgi:hypothetical protein
MAKIFLTPEFIQNGLKPEDGKSATEYCDTNPSSKGLYVYVSAARLNFGTYKVRLKLHGGSEHFFIGSTDDVTLRTARQETVNLRRQRDQGTLVKAKQEPKAVELTFAKFFEDHYYPYVATPEFVNDDETPGEVNLVSAVVTFC